MSDRQPILLSKVAPTALQLFDKYLLVRKLAEGGMAEIFLAKQTGAEGFERNVVIKCMLSQFSGSREFVDMFLDEARVAAKLFHPNIVQIMDLGVANQRYFICMEYLAGEDLEAILARLRQLGQQIPIPMAAKIILGACEGLEFAHSHQERGERVNLVHRDVSPSNILVTFQGTPKVLDFGIAKASSKLAHTQPGTLKGKLGYMSPEQVRGAVLDERSDIFSLGVTFFELLTGRRVFDRDNELGVLMALMEHPVDAPSKHRPEIPEELDRIILKALARKVEDRYSNCGELRADLEAFLGTVKSPSTTVVGSYVQQLFGPEHVARKTQVPTIKELEQQGRSEEGGIHVSAPTFVRSNLEAAGGKVAAPAGFEPLSPGKKRWPWVIAGGLLVAGLAAGGTFLSLRVQPQVLPTPTPAPEIVVAPSMDPPVVPLTSPSVTPPEQTDPSPAPVAEKEVLAPTLRRSAPPAARVLTRQDVLQVLQRNGQAILSCGKTHRDQLPADGMVRVLMSIQHSGALREAKVLLPSVADAELGKCLEKKLRALKFPRNSNDPELAVEQPLRFQ